MLHIVKDYRKRTANRMVIECDGCGDVADWTASAQWMQIDRVDLHPRLDLCDECAPNKQFSAADEWLLSRLVEATRVDHPQPWHIERDWTYEVLDANGSVVMKCQSILQADKLIALSRRNAL